MKTPGPNHPIAIAPQIGRVRVLLVGELIAESTRALSLQEARYPAVVYIPRADIRADALSRSAHTTHCPFKGDASYYDLIVGGTRRSNAVWSYEDPYPAVAAIKDHMSFYPDRVDAIVMDPA